ncbi:MAG: helix-turn-helix domain-containing protein [Thermoplasmatota archaeon]
MREEEKAGRADAFRIAASAALALLLLAFFSITFTEPVLGQDTNDQDEDGMDDTWEEQYNLNSSDPSDANLDPDQDQLTNREEYWNSTDPTRNDTDSDGMPDGWEVLYGLDPNFDDSDMDKDGDGIPNLREYQMGWDPTNPMEPPDGVDDDDDISPDDDDAVSDEAGSMASPLFCLVFVFILIVGFIVLMVGIGIYSKIKKDRLMDHETRQRIVDFLRENPGAYYSQMRKELDLAHGVLTHHLNILEQQELLFSKQDRSYRRFYLDGMHRKGPIVVGKQKEVLEMVRRYPGSSQSEIGRRLDMGRMIVSYHINQLEELGLIFKIKHGRENLIHPAGEGEGPEPGYGAGVDQFGRGPYGTDIRETGNVEG